MAGLCASFRASTAFGGSIKSDLTSSISACPGRQARDRTRRRATRAAMQASKTCRARTPGDRAPQLPGLMTALTAMLGRFMESRRPPPTVIRKLSSAFVTPSGRRGRGTRSLRSATGRVEVRSALSAAGCHPPPHSGPLHPPRGMRGREQARGNRPSEVCFPAALRAIIRGQSSALGERGRHRGLAMHATRRCHCAERSDEAIRWPAVCFRQISAQMRTMRAPQATDSHLAFDKLHIMCYLRNIG